MKILNLHPIYKNIFNTILLKLCKYLFRYVLTISESKTVMFKLGNGVPGAIFSGIETK